MGHSDPRSYVVPSSLCLTQLLLNSHRSTTNHYIATDNWGLELVCVQGKPGLNRTKPLQVVSSRSKSDPDRSQTRPEQVHAGSMGTPIAQPHPLNKYT
jgi:hypothetical protein